MVNGVLVSDMTKHAQKQQWAEDMRKNPTPAEAALWGWLKTFGFKTQVVVLGYILDFYSSRYKLCIEVDGASHIGRQEWDRNRDAALGRLGIRALRLSNELVLEAMGAAKGIVRNAVYERAEKKRVAQAAKKGRPVMSKTIIRERYAKRRKNR